MLLITVENSETLSATLVGASTGSPISNPPNQTGSARMGMGMSLVFILARNYQKSRDPCPWIFSTTTMFWSALIWVRRFLNATRSVWRDTDIVTVSSSMSTRIRGSLESEGSQLIIGRTVIEILAAMLCLKRI